MGGQAEHPLVRLLRRAAGGSYPSEDGSVEVLPSPPGRADAVVAFTAHTVIAADVDPAEVARTLPTGSLSGPMLPPFLGWLAERLGREAGNLDLVLSARWQPEPPLGVARLQDLDHPRLRRAERYRSDLRAYATDDRAGVIVIGRGLGSRYEVAIEVAPTRRAAGLGRSLALAARSLVPPDEPLFAQVAPGNAASLRAFLAAGYVPLGAEVLFLER